MCSLDETPAAPQPPSQHLIAKAISKTDLSSKVDSLSFLSFSICIIKI